MKANRTPYSEPMGLFHRDDYCYTHRDLPLQTLAAAIVVAAYAGGIDGNRDEAHS